MLPYHIYYLSYGTYVLEGKKNNSETYVPQQVINVVKDKQVLIYNMEKYHKISVSTTSF